MSQITSRCRFDSPSRFTSDSIVIHSWLLGERLALTHVDGGVGVADSLLTEATLLQSSVHRLQGNLLLRVHLLRLELVDAKQPVVPVQNAEIGIAFFFVG